MYAVGLYPVPVAFTVSADVGVYALTEGVVVSARPGVLISPDVVAVDAFTGAMYPGSPGRAAPLLSGIS